MERNGIKKAIELAGSQSKLASILGVSPQFICQLAAGDRPVPARLARKIESATDGEVTAAELLPEIFGEIEDKAA